MRSDYALYSVAIIFFIITGISFILVLNEFERNLSVVATAILGFLFVGLGYSIKPKTKTATTSIAVTQPPPAPPPLTEEIKMEKKNEAVAVQSSIQIKELTAVKGIKEKRAKQLKSLGINTIEDLANASADELAAKLKTSSKFTAQWIQNAKELLNKS